MIADTWRSRRGPTYSLDALDGAFDLEDPAISPEDAAIGADWSRQLAKLRQDCLKEGERDLLDLRLQGLNDREIATALGRSHGSIRTAQYRMVQRLRDCLGIGARAREAGHADL